MTSLWDRLPADLRDYILDIRRRYITTIQKCWRRYLVQQRPFVIADAMIKIGRNDYDHSRNNYAQPGHGYVDTMCPDTSKAIIYCAKLAKITKKTTKLFWMEFTLTVLIHIGQPRVTVTEAAAINDLSNKFHLWHRIDVFDVPRDE